MCVYWALQWTGVPFSVFSFLVPGVDGIESGSDPDQEKAVTMKE